MSLSQILWPTTIVNVAFLKVFFKLLAKFFKIKLSAEFFFLVFLPGRCFCLQLRI